MQLDPPASGVDEVRRRFHRVLTWRSLVLLAVLTLALVIASLALDPDAQPAPPPAPPMRFSPPVGHPMPQ
jgi:hypothetical protein